MSENPGATPEFLKSLNEAMEEMEWEYLHPTYDAALKEQTEIDTERSDDD